MSFINIVALICHNAVVLILFAVAGQIFLSRGYELPVQAC